MAKINNFKDTEGIEKEQQFLNCNKTMREHFCWATGSTQQLSAQQATFIYAILQQREILNFKMLDGIINIEKIDDFYMVQKFKK